MGSAPTVLSSRSHLTLDRSSHDALPNSGVRMSIPTQMSLVGFVASAPELHFTKQGAECCRLRVGVEPELGQMA